MARILVIGNRATERQGLALFMEFAGHQCAETGSLEEARRMMQNEAYDLVLADSQVGNDDSDGITKAIRAAAPSVNLMIMAEELSSSPVDDVITTPLTMMQGVSPQFPLVRKREAFLVMLPEQESLKMLRDLPESPGLLNKLALLYHSQKKHTAAEQLYQRALEASRKNPAEQRRYEASILMNLATLYHDLKRYNDAEPLYRRSLDLAESAYGADHPKVARRLRRLAEIYRVQGKDNLAAPVHERLQRMA
jgi:tetratricopeptide (TPR) repeat protein